MGLQGPGKFNIDHYRGDKLVILLRLWEDTKKTIPADLSNATVTSQIRAKPQSAVIAGEFEITEGALPNERILVIWPENQSTLPSKGAWDCQVDWQSDGKDVQTVVYGEFKMTYDVTRVEAAKS